ncbi:MAG: radical SAM protein [Candidatus Omnitrophica bacterium]|jgi:MoaA/NifB/PqqE/SkfB family radical SAM enzyme|nr:radical SAM protein [Candidatus Omnitrophota bacterium]MDD5080129.1 radical SAM protein [Candidatus Omnitrophota bacterium]
MGLKISLNKRGLGVAWGSLFRQMCFYRNIFGITAAWKAALSGLAYVSNIRVFGGPLTVNLLITDECNLNCSICSYQNKRNSPGMQMSLEQVNGFIAACAKEKPALFFSGGEPFMRRDILEMLRTAKKYGLKCGINTNGSLMDDQAISGLAGLGVELVVFSLYGPQHIHDAITGVNGSFDKALVNMRQLCRKKSKITRVIVSCAINKYNIDHLSSIPRIAREAGADAVKFEHLNFLTSGESGSKGPGVAANTHIDEGESFSEGFVNRLIAVLDEIKKIYGDFVMVKPGLSREEIISWYGVPFRSSRRCFFPWHSVFVKPDGTVIPCQFLQDRALGNIAENRLGEVFNSRAMRDLRGELKSGLLPECARCCKL